MEKKSYKSLLMIKIIEKLETIVILQVNIDVQDIVFVTDISTSVQTCLYKFVRVRLNIIEYCRFCCVVWTNISVVRFHLFHGIG